MVTTAFTDQASVSSIKIEKPVEIALSRKFMQRSEPDRFIIAKKINRHTQKCTDTRSASRIKP